VSEQALLARVVRALEDAQIPYMLTGSVVSSFQGDPRASHDIDVVVEITTDQVSVLASAFASDQFAFDEVAAREAIAKRDMFQPMDFYTGDKVDFWVLKDELLIAMSSAADIRTQLPTLLHSFLRRKTRFCESCSGRAIMRVKDNFATRLACTNYSLRSSICRICSSG
jgi:hypothetical protein